MNTLLVTGGAGFIGSCFTIQQIEAGHKVIVLDNLSYAANLNNLDEIRNHPHFTFVQGDIGDAQLVQKTIRNHNINKIVNFAAESHVDNSITGPEVFITTNVLGTYHLLWEALQYWQDNNKPDDFRFLHVSTDEVFGQLELGTNEKFSETTAYDPSSPYSASKAASDHLVRAWNHTYGLPTIITNCSNNYGPRQHHEKLIPHMIYCALNGLPLPVYGDGKNVRDWIHVEDHTKGIALALENAEPGETFCFGGDAERENITLVNTICETLDRLRPRLDKKSYKEQITFVTDRLGHDRRYAIDDSKARDILNYRTDTSFEDRFEETIQWYLAHDERLKIAA